MKQFQEFAGSTSKGLEQLEGEYTMKLALLSCLMKAVKEELERMQEFGVIVPVTELTDWCSGMSMVPKRIIKFVYVWI